MSKSKEGKHTKLPWDISKDGPCGVYGDGVFICGTNANSEDVETNRANAELICRAVNSHEKLLECLKEAYSFIGTPTAKSIKWKEAIAKAEGLE